MDDQAKHFFHPGYFPLSQSGVRVMWFLVTETIDHHHRTITVFVRLTATCKFSSAQYSEAYMENIYVISDIPESPRLFSDVHRPSR